MRFLKKLFQKQDLKKGKKKFTIPLRKRIRSSLRGKNIECFNSGGIDHPFCPRNTCFLSYLVPLTLHLHLVHVHDPHFAYLFLCSLVVCLLLTFGIDS